MINKNRPKRQIVGGNKMEEQSKKSKKEIKKKKIKYEIESESIHIDGHYNTNTYYGKIAEEEETKKKSSIIIKDK